MSVHGVVEVEDEQVREVVDIERPVDGVTDFDGLPTVGRLDSQFGQ
jgi:hypothetical protein